MNHKEAIYFHQVAFLLGGGGGVGGGGGGVRGGLVLPADETLTVHVHVHVHAYTLHCTVRPHLSPR